MRIRLRRDTAANLASVTLQEGEPAFETDTGILRVGDGSTAFSSLDSYALLSGDDLTVAGVLEHDGSTVGFLGATPAAQQAHVADPAGGATVDAEARTAINSILSTLETFGFHATS